MNLFNVSLIGLLLTVTINSLVGGIPVKKKADSIRVFLAEHPFATKIPDVGSKPNKGIKSEQGEVGGGMSGKNKRQLLTGNGRLFEWLSQILHPGTSYSNNQFDDDYDDDYCDYYDHDHYHDYHSGHHHHHHGGHSDYGGKEFYPMNRPDQKPTHINQLVGQHPHEVISGLLLPLPGGPSGTYSHIPRDPEVIRQFASRIRRLNKPKRAPLRSL